MTEREWLRRNRSGGTYQDYLNNQVNKYGKGNIDLTNRPVYINSDNTISTVDSVTVGIDGKQYLLPSIVTDKNGKAKRLNTTDDIVNHYKTTGEYLGVFDTQEEADRYGVDLHNSQADYYGKRKHLAFDNEGETLYFGNVTDEGYKAITEGNLANYTPKDASERLAIAEFSKWATEEAKRQRNPENWWKGILHSIPYSLGKFGAGAVDFVGDIGDLALAGISGAGGLLADIGSKAAGLTGSDYLENHLGQLSDEMYDNAEYRLQADTLGDMWNASIESRYRVPDWYRENVGQSFMSAGSMTVPVVVELATKGLAPTEAYTSAQLAKMASTASATKSTGFAQATKNLANKLITPSMSTHEALFGLGATASATKEAYKETGNVGKSLTYGVLNGLGEVATERLFGGYAGTGYGSGSSTITSGGRIMKVLPDVVEPLFNHGSVKYISKFASTKFGSKVLNLAFEGVEEGIMAWADPVFRKATINSDKGLKELYGDAKFGEAFFQGILLSTIMNAGQYAIGKPIEKFTDYRRKINFINVLNTDTQKINEMLPEGTATFEPLGKKATQEEIEQRYSDLERVSVIIGVNKAIDAVNSIVKSDESKIIPLGNDATIEEIQQRQKELMSFGTQYADLMAEELVKNNPNAFSNLETPSNSFANNQADTIPIQEEKPLKTEFQVANEKANEAAFEAGRQNIPREKVNLTTLEQEEAYNRGRIEHIKNMPKATTKSSTETTNKTILGDGEKSIGVANGQAYVTNGKDILPSPTNRSVFIPVDNVEVAKTELGATESNKTSENISKILASDFTPVREDFVDGTLENVGEVRVFTDENGREIALEKSVAEYFEDYNLEATFRGGKPYAIKATDNNGKVVGVAMAVWVNESGQNYKMTATEGTNTIQTENTVKTAKNTVRDDIVNSRQRQTFTLGELNEISEADETLDVQEVRDVTGYGEKGAELVTKYANYEGVSLGRVMSEVEDAYFEGFENPNKPMGKFETKAQEQAYKAGQEDKKSQLAKARDNSKKATIYKGAFTENEYTKNFTKAEKTMISIVAKALKMDISVVDKIIANEFTGQEANAEHQNGKMRISSTAEQIAQKVLYKLVMHESGHRLKQLAPDEFGVLMDALYERSKRENAKSGRYQHAGFDNVKSDYENADLAMSNESMDTLDYFEEFAVRELETIFSSAREFNKWYAEISGNKQVKSAWDKFVDFILDAIDSIKRKLQLATMSKDERAKANKSLAELDRIKGLLANTYKAAESAVAEKNGTVVDAKGNVVAQINEDGTASFSLKTYDDSGRAELKRWLDRNVKNKKLTEAEAKDISEQLEYYYDICKQYEDKYAPFSAWSKAEVVKGLDGKPLMSVVKANGDYKMNLDFSLVCKKRRPLDALYRAMIDDGFMDNIGQLSEVEVARINEIIRKNGFETACTLCFVDSKRYRQYAVADSFVSKYNELVKMLAPESAKIDRFDFSGKREASADGLHTMSDAELKAGINKLNKVIKEHGETTVVGKIAKHLKAVPRDRKLVMVSDFMDSEGFVRVKKANPSVFKLYNSSKGSGGPKATLPDVQYLGEILKKANFTPKNAYAVGGVRVQSFSDYIPRLVFDYLQMTADLTAKKLPAHAYSKEDIFVMQFGKTGIKINMSLVPAVAKDGIAPGLDKDGNYVWVDGHTFASDFHKKGSGQKGFELAVEIQNTEGYSENCGTIAVGVSNEHIAKMLKDNDIRMVIPYHKSSLNHFVAQMGNIDQYHDYTSVQNTRDKATGKKITGKDFNFNEAFHRLGDAKAATNEYLAWCEKNNYIPKFDEFAFHDDAEVRENYYKVLIDFAAYDSDGNSIPQRAVTMNFPTENDAFGSMKSLIEKGLEADAILEGRKANDIPKILKEVKAELGKKTEGKKFSLKEDVEETKDLIAVHNTSESQLIDSLTRGQFIMPSLAVTNKSHTSFGDISVVFYKDTINPENDASNKLYGADAWTPTQTTLKINPKFDNAKTEAVIGRIKKSIGRGWSQIFDVNGVTFKNAIKSAQGSVYGAYAENIGVQTAFAVENGIISVPPRQNGKIDVSALKDTLDSSLNKDEVWRSYKKWLGEISDDIITSYDKASTQDIINNMKAQPDTAKVFAVSENGELTVPATEYSSIDEMRSNKNRLSENAETEAKAVGKEFVSWANDIAKKTDANVKKVIKAINASFNSRYDAMGIATSFQRGGVSISQTDAKALQTLYKKAVDLPTRYFEAKPGREVGVSEVAHIVLPNNTSESLKSLLSENGVNFTEYEKGNNDARTKALNSIDGVRFSLKDSEGNTLTKEQQEFFKDSKVRDENGNLLVVYHGSPAKFTVFDHYHINKRGNSHGRGFYFTEKKSLAEGYEKEGGQLLKGYLNITKPLSEDKKTMKKADLLKLIKATCEAEARMIVEDGGYDNVREAIRDTWISNCVNTYEMSMDSAYREVLNIFWNGNDNDVELISDLTNSGAGNENTLRQVHNVLGYDGVIYTAPDGTHEFVSLVSEQFKNIDNTNPTSNPDINFSLKGGLSDTEIRKAIADKKLSKYVEKGTITTEKYNELIEKYGVIPSGERPHRDIQVPQKSGKKKNVSQTVRTILEAEATPDEAVPTIEKMVEDGIFSYDTYTDKQAINDAENYIKEYGWDESLDDWFDAVNKGEVSKELTATGWALYNNAANLAATTTSETERTTAIKTSLKILDAMVRHQRSAAQALQATRILKKLSPETQLYGVQKSVSAFQKELTDKYGDKAPDLKIDEKLAEQFLNAKTSEERAKIEEKIYKDIGRQMPSRFIDKWNAWRYLAMLGNVRTHGRNIIGNAAFAPVVLAKNLTATAIESVVYRVSGKKMLRGKALITGNKADKALLKAAWGDFKNVSNLISNGGKYNDAAMNNQHIEDGRRIFKFKPLEWARKKNSQLLELEDMWFSQPHYAYALAQYCKANNITAEQISRGKAIAPARDYAIKEAQKATYRDTNAFSQMVSGWGRSKKDSNVIQKAFNTTIEGILPFRKTPANILVRGVEYSPLGLLKGLTYDLYQASKGKMSATDVIDNISAGLTGTGLLSLGIYLAAQGLIRGHGEEEEEEKGFKELMGHQSYALELPNGQSITLDWLAPEALPFFVGVNIWETSIGTDEKANLSTILKSVSNISEPMLELSCLQSLNDLFESVGYATSNDTSGLMSILSSAATSYLTQGIPTLLGQAERTGEENRMTTYTEKDNFFTGDMQYTLGKASAKIPYWDFNQIPYIDAWGRKEASGTKLKRGLNNFLNPAYTSKIETSNMENELLRLYEETGESSVFPSRADKYFVVDGVRKDLTADEYVRYATLKGEKSYKAVNNLVNSKAYRELSDGEKAKAIAEAYDYANQKAKDAISNYKPDSWVNKTDDSSSSNFISFKVEVSSTKDANDGKITKEQAVDIILDTAQNDSQKWQMYLSMYDSKTAAKAEKHDIDAELFMTAVVDMAEIKADYKANGKVVSGSRRKKIERYLNSVCSSYKEYLFLLGSEYDSVKDDADYISYFGKEEE